MPNLVVAEVFIRTRHTSIPPALKLVAAGVLAGATGLLLLGKYYFTNSYWGPTILQWLVG